MLICNSSVRYTIYLGNGSQIVVVVFVRNSSTVITSQKIYVYISLATTKLLRIHPGSFSWAAKTSWSKQRRTGHQVNFCITNSTTTPSIYHWFCLQLFSRIYIACWMKQTSCFITFLSPYPQLHWVQLPFSQRHFTAADLWLKTTARVTLSWTGEFL